MTSLATDSNALIDNWATLEPLSPDVDAPFRTRILKTALQWALTLAELIKARGFPAISDLSPDVMQFDWPSLHITRSPICFETGKAEVVVASTDADVWRSFLRALARATDLPRARVLSSRVRCGHCGRIYNHRPGTRLGFCRRCSRPLTCSPVWVGETQEVTAQ